MKKAFALLLILFLFCGKEAWAKGPFNKFGRGMTNIVTSPAEILLQMMNLSQEGYENDHVTAFFGGFLKGTVYMVGRIVTGAYEVVTFPFPIPAKYEPVWHPETVFEGFRDIT